MTQKPEVIVVQPSDAALVEKAHMIMDKAWKEADAEAAEASANAGRTIMAPMAFIHNPEEQLIIDAYDRLAEDYRISRNLNIPPILISPIPWQQYGTSVAPDFHQYHRKEQPTLSQLELTTLFLERIPVRKQGNILFVWQHTHYISLDDKAFRGLIEEVLHDELRFTNNANATINAILALLQSKRRIPSAPESADDRIALHNGVLNLESLQLEYANPCAFTTHFLDAKWDAGAPCPHFQNFLWSASGNDRELYQRFLEAIGFLLTPGNRAKKFVVFQGVPNSGKSVLGNLVQSFFTTGDFSSLPLHQFGDRFAMSALASHHLNISMDLPSGVIDAKAVGILKQVTGNDQVFVEPKGKDGYATTIDCKLLFGTNHHIELKTADVAFANRVLMVPFLYSVPNDRMDVHLLDKLRQEKPGILYMALVAYREVVRRNYQFTGEDRFGFKVQKIVPAAQPAESVKAFIGQCCQPEPDSFLSTEQLHQAFEAFCCQAGLPTIEDRSSFSRALRTCLGDQVKAAKRRVGGTPLNGYVGINFQNKAN